MIVQFISAIALSILAILFCWAIFRTLKKSMPKYLYPIVAAASVIGYGIYSEYTWADRTIAQLPTSVVIVHRLAGTSAFSPWSFVLPRIDRISMVDKATVRRHDHFPDQVMMELLLLQRFSPVVRVQQLIDCRYERRTDVRDNTSFSDDGLPTNVQWENLDSEHPLLITMCA